MATWQPPIPSGALYSPAATALGAGLALLAWCYDQVERDGSVQVNLEKAAADIGKPYGTVRDWWRDMKDDKETGKSSPFFSEIIPQGRKGWRVKFKSKWLDWRIVEKNYPQRRDFSDETEITAESPAINKDRGNGAENPAGNNNTSKNTVEISEVSSQFDRRDFSDQGSAYKVLITTDQAGVECADAAAPRAPQKRSRKEQPPTPLPIREALAGVCHIGKLSTREQHLQLNQSAAAIWRAQSAQGHDPEKIAADIRYVADHFAKNDWRGKKGDIPRPSDIRENWQAAMDVRASPPPKPATKYYQPPAGDYLQGEELAAAFRAAREKRAQMRQIGDA